MTRTSRHWRPSRQRRIEAKDLTQGHALTREKVEAFSKRAPEDFWAAFWKRVDLDPTPGSCWLWTGTKTQTGYGQVVFGADENGKRKRMLAHRIAYVSMEGDLQAGQDLLHSCDETRCVNPGHLRPGDQAANLADMYAKGRDIHSKRRTAS